MRGRNWVATAIVLALAAVLVPQALGRGGSSEIDAGWKSVAGAAKPVAVKNDLVRGTLARRDRATRAWKRASARYTKALTRARTARGAQRARAMAAAKALAPAPESKPEYVVVWAGKENAGDQSTRGAQSDLSRAQSNPSAYADEARSRVAPGLDAFVVIDARRREVDGTPNPQYGKVVNFVQLPPPFGVEAEPHHMQYQWEPGQPLLAGGLFNDTTFVLGVENVPELKLLNTITPQDTPNGSVPDAYDYAGDGRFIGTYMGGPNTNFAGSPGAVVAFKPDPQKGLVVASETPAGVPGARENGNPGGIPEPCSEEEAQPLGTCANPHGIQIREDLNRMITSDYAEPKLVVLDPVKPVGGAGFRPTVRTWDTTNPDHPKLVSVAHVPTGWRAPSANSMQANRGVMEAAKTWPASDRFPRALRSNGVFAGAMCGGGVFFAPDFAALKGDATRQWRQVWDDGISLLRARDGDVDDWMRDRGPCEGGAWTQVSRNNRWLFRAVSGNAPNADNLSTNGQPNKIVYDLDIQPLIRSAQDGKIDCDLTRGIDTNGDRKVDISAPDAVRRLALGETVADCPRLIDTIDIEDKTTGGPHWGALDNHSLTSDGTPTRMVVSDYFVARSGVDGNHRLYMVDIDPVTGQLSHNRAWRDEVTGQLGTNFNRRDWPGNPDAGFYKPHSMVWVCPPGVCAKDAPAADAPASAPAEGAPTTFSGDCKFKGAIHARNPYKLEPEVNDSFARATGTCTGQLNGKPYSGPAQLFVDARMNRVMSCEFGHSLVPPSPGSITFGTSEDDLDAPQIGLLIEEFHVFTEMPLSVKGAFNGHALGHLTQRNYAGPEAAKACAEGGVNDLEYDAEIKTIRPLYG